MQEVRNHEAYVPNDLMQVSFAEEDVLNELVDAPSDNVEKSRPDNAQHLSGCYEVLLVGQVKHKRGGEQLGQLH